MTRSKKPRRSRRPSQVHDTSSPGTHHGTRSNEFRRKIQYAAHRVSAPSFTIGCTVYLRRKRDLPSLFPYRPHWSDHCLSTIVRPLQVPPLGTHGSRGPGAVNAVSIPIAGDRAKGGLHQEALPHVKAEPEALVHVEAEPEDLVHVKVEPKDEALLDVKGEE